MLFAPMNLPGKTTMSTYQALLEQKKALDQRIAEARKAEAREALATVHALIAEFGFTAQQVFPWKPAARKAPARYRDPVTGATWSGRGKPPRWINGKDRAAFEI
jgi:DNA-binding protein H-NS